MNELTFQFSFEAKVEQSLLKKWQDFIFALAILTENAIENKVYEGRRVKLFKEGEKLWAMS
jgi:hypothetical protein